jgi:hypothetical protein
MGRTIEVDLRVHEALRDEVYKDVVRVFWRHRNGLPVSSIVKVSCNGRGPFYFAIRGLDEKDQDCIFLDWLGRQRLGNLQPDEIYRFKISTTNPWEKLQWACLAADPAARIAAWIAVWSAVVGMIGLVLGIIGVVPVIKEWVGQKPEPHMTAPREELRAPEAPASQ